MHSLNGSTVYALLLQGQKQLLPYPSPQVPPVMGAYYHTIHHTMYNKNYGHYFTFVDRLFGTLLTPEDYRAMIAERKVAKET